MMKTIILSSLFSFVILFGCSTENSGSVNTNDPEIKNSLLAEGDVKNQEVGTIKMTKSDFLANVMDYENSQEWNYKGDLPCLIDFYADWCGPCKIAAPVLEELAKEYHGKIYIYKVDTQVERELSSVFGIQSIPAFLFCPSEGQPTMSSGIARTPEQTKEMFKQMIDEILLKETVSQSL